MAVPPSSHWLSLTDEFWLEIVNQFGKKKKKAADKTRHKHNGKHNPQIAHCHPVESQCPTLSN